MVVPPAAAVRVAVSEELTVVTVAVKPALLAPAGTVTEVGTLTAELLLERLAASPPEPAAAVSVTVQASLPAPVIEPLPQLNALNVPAVACPVPLKLIVAVAPLDALLVSVTAPLAAPAVVGSKATVSVAVWPGFRVSGKLTPDILKPDPVTLPALRIRAAVPDEVSVTDCVAGVFKFTSPKDTLVD